MKSTNEKDLSFYFGCGYKRGEIGICVADYSTDEKACLCVTQEGKAFKVGEFIDVKTACEFMHILDYVMFGNEEDTVVKILSKWEEEDKADESNN